MGYFIIGCLWLMYASITIFCFISGLWKLGIIGFVIINILSYNIGLDIGEKKESKEINQN